MIMQTDRITESEAMLIAVDWHGGQWTMMYAFSCVGDDTVKDSSDKYYLLGEIKDCITQTDDADEYYRLCEFYNYVNTLIVYDEEE